MALVDAFTRFGLVDSVINRGGYKAAVRLQRGPQADLMIMPPGEAGTYRIHFTGSKEHNVKLRAMARDQGWSLSEKGFLRIGEDGEPLTGDAAELRTFGTEAEAYAFLGLPYIEPELREDTGEIEAALAGRLPDLIDLADLRGDLHSHSDWSDGHHPIEVMAEAARARGYAYQVLTDHSQSLAIARGLTPDRVARAGRGDRRAQRPVRGRGGGRHGPAGDTGRGLPAPPRLRARGPRGRHARLRGRPAGPLRRGRRVGPRRSAPDPGRADPAHAQRASGARTSTSSPIPSGRKIGQRDDLDLDWDAVYAEAARTGTALEMNGSPPRLDLAVERARRAVGIGCLVSIDSDAHDIRELDYVRWGISQARRAWIDPGVVLNTRSRDGPARLDRGASRIAWRLQVRRRLGATAVPRGRADRDTTTSSAMDEGSPAATWRWSRSRSSGCPGSSSRRSSGSSAGALLGAMLLGTLQVLHDEAAPIQAWFGVPIESVILPSVAAVACLGAIRLVPFGLWLVPALGIT